MPEDLYRRWFTYELVADVRHELTHRAAGQGLSGLALHDFVLAANELVTNAVMHGGGRGELRLWREDGTLWCEVSDHGPGIPAYELHHQAPGGGMGLWLVRLVGDTVKIETGPDGTIVQVATRLTYDGTGNATPAPSLAW